MYTEWTSHLKSDEAKQNFENQIINSVDVLRRLNAILNHYEKSLDRTETSIDTYALPNWEHRQAHKNGNREIIQRIKTLIDIDQQRIKDDPKSTG
jgi:hypothetical protein